MRQNCPKLQCLGGSAGHASQAESVSERKAKGRLESESAEERRKLCAIGSCRMLAKHVRSQDNEKSCEMLSEHDVSGEPSGSGETINGLQEEMFGMWLDHVEGEVVKLEVLLGYQGLGPTPRIRAERVREAVGDLQEFGKHWLDAGTAGLCLAKIQEELEEQEGWVTMHEEVMLQPRTLSMAEVYEDLSSWIPPMAEELQALTVTHEAIRVITKQDVEQMSRDGFLVETIPSRLVPVLKPPDAKKRARIVGCGNYVELRDRNQERASSLSSPVTDRVYDRKALYASGLDMDALRIQLRFSAGQPNWTALMTDVRTAFLLAPARSRGDSRRRVVLIPPKALVKAGLVSESDRFLIIKAVYGLAESPGDWSVFRDSTMKVFEWHTRTGGHRRLRQLVAEPSLWFVVEVQSNSEMQEPTILALLGVYVDDILLTGVREELDDFYQALAGLWKLADPSWLEDGIKFCGIQIELGRDGSWLLHQDDYLLELLRRYEIGHANNELPTFREGYEEPESYSIATLKRAQKVVGELLWLSGRTRMDICYHVCKLGQLLSKHPQRVYEDAVRVLQHLARTSAVRLRYGGFQESWPGDQVLRYQRDQDVVESWSDASFGQADGRSHSGVALVLAGGLVSWHSSRQSLVCLSTAESEMVAAVESMTLGRALSPIWIELTQLEPRWILNVDNLACTHLLVLPGGAWRTRHLRLRASHFREAIEQGVLCISHIPGSEMLPDILTKPMPWTRMQSLMLLAGYVMQSSVGESSLSVSHAVKALLCVYLASQMPIRAEAAEMELMDMEVESSVFSFSISEWLFVGLVVGFWELLKYGLRKLWRVFDWLRQQIQGKRDKRFFEGVKGKVDILLREPYRSSSLGNQQRLLARSYGLPSLRIQTIDSEDSWELFWEYRVLVRWHARERRHMYVPDQYPLQEVFTFTGQRRTVVIQGSQVSEIQDDVTRPNPKRREGRVPWTGRTEFQLESKD